MRILIVVVLSLFMWSSNAPGANCNASITASTPTGDFVDNGDETVTHSKTDLMWKQCSEGLSGSSCGTGSATALSWQAALQLAETLNNGVGFAGYTDWRVPNLKELTSIIEVQCTNRAINATIFPATMGSFYWSASPYAGNASTAWDVHFNFAYADADNKTDNYYVRLVRSVL